MISIFPALVLVLSLFAFADLLLAVRSTEYHTRLLSEYAWQFKLMLTQHHAAPTPPMSAPADLPNLDLLVQQLEQVQQQQAAQLDHLTTAMEQLTAQQQASTETLRLIAENTRAAAWLLNQQRS
ncbi:MAG: hypothetical protein HC911_01975 [Chloroflexaceae bacterium]|nr:hypothetical protein [Chloroflexaceae bacterium]